MIKKIAAFLPLVFFLVLLLVLLSGLSIDPKKIPSPLIHQKVPVFHLPSLYPDKPALNERVFQGNVTLLNVFATWCTTCVTEHAFLMQLKDDARIAIVGLDYKDDLSDARRYLLDRGSPYTVVIADPRGELSLDLGVYGTPETFLIDKKGVIRYKLVGELTEAVYEKTVKPLITQLQAESI